MSKIECTRCGLCCHYIIRDPRTHVEKLIRCKHLVVSTRSSITRCAIWSRRLGSRIAKNFHCTLRVLSPLDYPGCPYNTDKPYTKLHYDYSVGVTRHD